MQAPGFRMNEREANPNPYVGFIRALKMRKDHTEAESMLKAIAAQMKRIMQQRFMFVHTLEEAAFNRVFAGRNWNHGQSIELVLRGPTGRFLPLTYITAVMCHEMAHIEHMNHGPKFQKLMADIKDDVRKMQAKGNYGDGFWSDGQRLNDSVKMGAEGLRPSDFPEYVCGVTSGDAKKATRPRRGGPRASGSTGLVKGEASHLSGRQTEYQRKAGRRNNADMGESLGRLDGKQGITSEDEEKRKREINELVEDLVTGGLELKKAKAKAARDWKKENAWYTEGNSRGKVAKSKTAAELRAAAAEKRLAALNTKSEPKEEHDDEDNYDELKAEEEDVPDPHLDPATRRKQMESEMSENEMEGLRGGWADIFPSLAGSSRMAMIKRELSPNAEDASAQTKKANTAPHPRTRFGSELVREEQKRGLGLSGTSRQAKGQVLGSVQATDKGEISVGQSNEVVREDGKRGWACGVCTFANIMDHGRCEMCGARPDGEMPYDD